MTPKEKAEKLCIDFLINPNTRDSRFGIDKQLAKQCAIIAVNEIIENVNYFFDELERDRLPNYFDDEIDYWEQVIDEINKL